MKGSTANIALQILRYPEKATGKAGAMRLGHGPREAGCGVDYTKRAHRDANG